MIHLPNLDVSPYGAVAQGRNGRLGATKDASKLNSLLCLTVNSIAASINRTPLGASGFCIHQTGLYATNSYQERKKLEV